MGINNKTTFEPPKERVFTNTASVSALIDPKDDPVTDGARKERELVERDLNRARGGIDLSERTGRLNRGQASGNEQNFQAQKEKEKYDGAMRTAMSQAKKAIDQLVEDALKDIERIDKGLDATSKLKKMIKDGTFDKTDPATLLILQQAGISPDDIDPVNPSKSVEKREKELVHEKEKALEVLKEADNIQKRIVSEGVTPEIAEEIKNLKSTVHGQELTDAVFTKAILSQKSSEDLANISKARGYTEEESSALDDLNDPNAFFGVDSICNEFNGCARGEALPETKIAYNTDITDNPRIGTSAPIAHKF